MTEAPDETTGTDDIAGRTKRGLLWRFAAQGVSGVIELGVGIVLARLLMPEDFGIMALAYMVMGFVAMFQTIGLPQALVQREVIDEDHKAAAFWTTLLMGFVLAGVIILLAGPAAVFFKEEAVRPVMRLMSVTMVLGATASVPRALLERRIDFKRLFWPDIVGGAVYGAVGITMAVLGYSYWSLAWGAIARGAANLVLVTTMARYAPRLTCRMQPLRDLFSFGAPVTLSSGLTWAAHNVDYFIIGRVLPTSALGIYRKAYEWVTLPWAKVVSPTYSVLFSAFSRLQGQPERLRYAYGRALTGLSTVTFPILGLLWLLAPEAVPSVFGAQWESAILPTRILCGVGLLRCLGNPTGALIKGTGYVNAELGINVVHLVLVALGTWLAAPYGLVAICWAVVAAQALVTAVVFAIPWIAVGWTPLMFVAALGAPLAATAACVAVAATAAALMPSACPSLMRVTLAGLAGGAAYMLLVLYGPFRAARTSVGLLADPSFRRSS